MAGGVEQGLAQAVAAGLPPFAVVAVDGGGGYWHKRASGDDSGAMVLDELIPMLGEQGLDTSRVGVPRLVDGRLRRAAARRPARVRREPPRSARSARRCGRRRVRRRPVRSTAPTTTPPTACGGCRRSARFRSESTAATAIRSTPPPSSSSRSCRTRPRAASPPAATTARSGVRSCPPKSRGWHRFSSPSELDADPALGRGQPDVGAEVAAGQPNRLASRA